MRRVLPWIAVIAAALIGIFAAVELRTRWDADDVAMGPTLEPSPTELPTPTDEEPSPVETPGEQTDLPSTPEAATPTATIMAAESPTEEPTEEPTTAPTTAPTAAPTVPTPEPSGDPMPHTGGGAVGGGLAVIAMAAALGVAVRRSYSSDQRS